jgi:putative ABC transport system ATP-binding protein
MNDIIVIEDAVRKYQRGVEEVLAIDGVDLTISQGDFVAVVGRSGSGKTTLLNLIGCVDRPTNGRVTVHGVETVDLPEKALATIRSTTIGFVFQQFFLIPTLTAVENVMVPGRFCADRRDNGLKSRALELLDIVGLSDRADHLPHELSGGEMQRVALARALINEPPILLADEPTGNLDTKSAEMIATIFEKLNDGGLTIVVVTHSTELTGNARRILYLVDGKIVEDQRKRPVPAAESEPDTEPEPMAAPEYMPSSLKKRKFGSPIAAVSMVLLGALIFATAFMPWIGKFSGYGLTDRGTFFAQFYKENLLTRVITSDPAVLFTGVWPIILGSLLVVAGILFLLNLQRIGRWSAAAIGVGAGIVAITDILMINNRLGPEVPVEYGLWVLLGVGIAASVLGVLLMLVSRFRASSQLEED